MDPIETFKPHSGYRIADQVLCLPARTLGSKPHGLSCGCHAGLWIFEQSCLTVLTRALSSSSRWQPQTNRAVRLAFVESPRALRGVRNPEASQRVDQRTETGHSQHGLHTVLASSPNRRSRRPRTRLGDPSNSLVHSEPRLLRSSIWQLPAPDCAMSVRERADSIL